MKDKISIVVPVYNTEKYLKRCIDSILGQSHSNIEVILVDDGSTDESGRICDEYAQKDIRVQVIHQKNGGQSVARNVGLKYISGDYIGFVDSDDWIHKNMYSYLLTILKNTNSDVADIEHISCRNERIKLRPVKEKVKVFHGKNILKEYLRKNEYAVWRKLYKRRLWDHVEFDEGKINEDVVSNFQALMEADVMVASNQIFYYYYNNSGSITNNGIRMADFDLIYAGNRLIELSASEEDRTLKRQAFVKKYRSYFTLLTKALFLGFADQTLDQDKIIKNLARKVRKHYWFLLFSNMAFNRKILMTIACISVKIYRYLLRRYKELLK